MIDDFKKNYSLIRILLVLLIIAVGLYLANILWAFINNFADIILVIMFAWLLSFALEPVVDKLARYAKLSRLLAAISTYALLAMLISGIVYFYIPSVNAQIYSVTKILPIKLHQAPPFIYKYGTSISDSLYNAVSYIPSVVSFLFLVFIVLLISFYFVVDKENINTELYSLTPRTWHKNMHFIQNVIETTFASFLRLQLLFAIMSGIYTFIVLFAFGIEYASFAGFLAGILTLIPLIGPFLAMVPPLLAAILVNANPTTIVIIFLILLLLQQVEFNILGPRLMSRAFQLHPVIVLISFLVGARIAGAAGALFAVPVLGILVIMFRQFGHYFINSEDRK